MKFKIIALGSFCFVVIFAIAVIVGNSVGVFIDDQSQRNYNRFVQNVDALTNTFRAPIEECAVKAIEQQDEECIKKIDEEYRIQFGSLIKLFGYDEYVQELYPYWKVDLQFWYDSKKIELENLLTPEIAELKIKQKSEIREQTVQDRLQFEFASQVEPNG